MTTGPHIVGRVNWYGAWTLYLREVWRFLKTPVRAILAPTATSLLFLAIFTLALGGTVREVKGVSLAEFLAPGLVMMAMVHAAFENAAGSLVQGKLLGNIVDILTPPLSPGEVTLALVLGGASRALITGAVLLVAMQPFVTLVPRHPEFVLFHALAASLLLAMVGVVAGLWAAKWDHLAAVTNFTVMPLMFLSGTFYSIERLPGAWHTASQLNPLFYVIDGFRYGFIGKADGALGLGVIVVATLVAALWLACHRLIAVGYNLKA
ncbi:MAG: ABC transporter permease [Alphaproteobacteria bacterium]